jgi:hypothetical protein
LTRTPDEYLGRIEQLEAENAVLHQSQQDIAKAAMSGEREKHHARQREVRCLPHPTPSTRGGISHSSWQTPPRFDLVRVVFFFPFGVHDAFSVACEDSQNTAERHIPDTVAAFFLHF